MKKITTVLSFVLVAAALLAACGRQEDAAAGKPAAAPAPAAAIVVGLDDNFPPMGFRDEKNALVGFDIDLASEAGKRLGAEVTFKPIDWNAKEAELNSKRVDVLWNGLTITEARKEKILFTTPYLENRQIIVVTDKSPVKDQGRPCRQGGRRAGRQQRDRGHREGCGDRQVAQGTEEVR
jgi:polar amino acid transport system substrate-binding protein